MKTAPADPTPDADRVLMARPDPLPAAVEVAVVGGGLAGLAVARRLARAGVQVHLLEARSDLALGGTGRDSGLVLPGTHDHAGRLADAVGAADAAKLLTWSARALSHARGLGATGGALEVAWSIDEAADLAAGIETLRAAGLAPVPWDLDPLQRVGWPAGTGLPGAALFTPQAGVIEPRVALAQLWADARAAGATASTRARVTGIDSGPVLHLDDGRAVSCDAVVLCAGWQMTAFEAFFGDKLYPVRHQHQLRVGGPALPVGLSTQGGYLTARPRPGGGMVVSGARWATQHLEAGETDDTVVQVQVSAAQDRFVAQRLALWAPHPVVARWTSIATHTCDNLPLVGPIPGRPSLLVCAGWNGRPWAWALAGAQAVCDGLLTGRAHGVPARVSPRRFLA